MRGGGAEDPFLGGNQFKRECSSSARKFYVHVHFVHHPWLGGLDKKKVKGKSVTGRLPPSGFRPFFLASDKNPARAECKDDGGGGAEISAAYLRNVKSKYYKVGARGYSYLTTLWTAKNLFYNRQDCCGRKPATLSIHEQVHSCSCIPQPPADTRKKPVNDNWGIFLCPIACVIVSISWRGGGINFDSLRKLIYRVIRICRRVSDELPGVARSELNCPRHEMRGFSCQILHSLYTPLRKQTVIFHLFTRTSGNLHSKKKMLFNNTSQHNLACTEKISYNIWRNKKKSVSYCVHSLFLCNTIFG